MAHNLPAWHCAHPYKPGLIKILDTYHEITHPYLSGCLQSTLSPDHLPTMSICTPKLSGTQRCLAWDNAPEIMAGEGRVGCILTQVGVDTFSRSARGACAASWVCGATLISKGGARKSEPSCLRKERWKAEHSIRAESEGRGGGLCGASLAAVLGKRGAAFSPQISIVLGNRSGLSGGWVPRASPSQTNIPHPPLSASPHQVLVRAALLSLFSSLSQESLPKLWSCS